MKTILIVRHAKSAWDNPLVKDFDRSLNDRGHKDAPAMARRLSAASIPLEYIISSPAKRAISTAKYFADIYQLPAQALIEEPSLYHAAADVFYDVISAADDNYNHLAVFSHNTGITDFVNSLCSKKVENMPTAAVFGIKIEEDSWLDFREAVKEFWFFDFPKNQQR